MLSKIRIKNFKSIVDLELSMGFEEGKAPNGYQDLETISFVESTNKKEDRLVPVMNIYGANASGKSNIIESIHNLKNIVLSSGEINLERTYKPNKLNVLDENFTTHTIECFIEKKLYKFILKYNNASILEETLLVEEKVLFSIRNDSLKIASFDVKNIVAKNYTEEDLRAIFDTECILQKDEHNTCQVKTFLNTVAKKLPNLRQDARNFYDFIADKLRLLLVDNYIPHHMAIEHANRYLSNKEGFSKISEFISNSLDIDILEFRRDIRVIGIGNTDDDFIRIANAGYHEFDFENEKVTLHEVKTIHKNNKGELVEFRLSEESAGTQLSFGLVAIILSALEIGGVLIIDELDKSLHPLLLRTLIGLFKDKQYNKKGAQLICTLHCTDILEDERYRVSEFAFVEKNIEKGTTITKLSEFEGARNDIKHRKRYLEGLYGGIPYTL